MFRSNLPQQGSAFSVRTGQIVSSTPERGTEWWSPTWAQKNRLQWEAAFVSELGRSRSWMLGRLEVLRLQQTVPSLQAVRE